MRKSVDKIIITNLPSFYKINLYNEIARQINILVIYTFDHAQGRNKDFYSGKMEFEHIFLSQSTSKRIRQLFDILHNTNYRELIIGGWDSISMWTSALVSPRKKNAVVVESSYYESTTRGIKGLIKRLFISRISKAYVSGQSQKKLVESLNFRGETIITKGVGVFNYIEQPPYIERQIVEKYIYVGRLTAVKNLHFLINTFNNLPHLQLTIVGFGELESELKCIANENITFTGAVDNKKLSEIYQNHDVFILPSYVEPWGLVVEEALNNGLPVIVSDKVGCAEEIIKDGENGFIFKSNDTESLNKCIAKMQDINSYNHMRKNISNINFKEIEEYQVKCYL